jgi:choline monooxygenase
MTRFEVHPDVAQAATIAKDFYLDPAVFASTRERVFAQSWQWLGTTEDVSTPGTLSPRDLLPGLLDEPLLLARDGLGALRCLSNVCTHRGHLLLTTACRASGIRCPYHSRRFELDGRMSFMPGFEGAADFPSPGDHLPQLPFGEWHGHAFASLAPRAPLAEVLADIEQRLSWLPFETFRADPSRSREFVFDAHWALYVENYLEGLHIPFVHPGLAQNLDLSDYRYEIYRHANLQLASAADGDAAFDPPPGSPDHGQRIAAYYWWVFPNLMLNFYPWGLSLNLVQPLGPDRTRVLFQSFVADPALLGAGAGAALDPVEMEDEAVVLTVQRGIRSRLYSRGRYSPRHERGVHHFHRLLCEALSSQ